MTLLRRLVGRSVLAMASVPGSRYCCICESRIAKFLPYTPKGLLPYRQPPFMAAMDVVGSDIANFSCPRCGAHDRITLEICRRAHPTHRA